MSQLDLIKQTLAGSKSDGEGSDIQWYRFPKSTEKILVRVLPPWQGTDFPLKLVVRHYNIPEADGGVKCPKTWDPNAHCPICQVLEEFDGRLDLKDYKQAVQAYGNALILKDPSQSGIDCRVPHVTTFSKGLLQWFADLWDDPNNRIIVDPVQGRNITVEREKYQGKFKVMPAFEPTAIAATQEEIGMITSQIRNLDEIFKPPGDEDLDKLNKQSIALKDMLENRVLSMGGSIGNQLPNQQAQPNQFNTQAAPPQQQYQQPVGQPAQPYQPPQQQQYQQPVQQQPAQPYQPPQQQPVQPNPGFQQAAQQFNNPGQFQPPAQAPVGQQPYQQPQTQPTMNMQQQTPIQQAPMQNAQPQQQQPVQSQTKVETPKNAPPCFGDKSVYNPQRGECLECQHEFHCSETVARG